MKNPFKKSNTELELSNVSKILSTGAAAGMAMQEDELSQDFNNNQ